MVDKQNVPTSFDNGIDSTENLSNDFQSLLDNGKSSDVTLLVGGGHFGEVKEFRAHRLVLTTRSEVFAAMFDHSDTKEAQEGRVEISDVSADVFEQFLRFIYTGKADQLERFGLDLFSLSDKV